MARRYLPWVVLLAATLHVVGVARTVVPAQDGLKFIRVAREFGHRPWSDVVRGSDQHPLYPMAIALVAPIGADLLGPGPGSWRVAAQAVSVIASLAMLLPLFGLTRRLFDERTAVLAALLCVVLPATGEIGHETLSDALALGLFVTALWLGERALRTGQLGPMVGCGLVAGLGYWTRPELVALPVAILVVVAGRALVAAVRQSADKADRPASLARASMLAVGFLAMVGGYALVKGEVSEKLAVRRAADIASKHDTPKPVAHWLPPGLDDPRFDFSPKEESERLRSFGPFPAVAAVLSKWAGGLGWVFAPMALVGALRVRARSDWGRWLVAAYAGLFGVILVRHAMGLGYLSDRHVLTLVVATLPWAASGTLAVAGRVADRCRWDDGRRRWVAAVCVALLVATGVALQSEPAHASRWGHRAAGLWLAEHADEGDAVLDTRGWAGFVSGLRSYDYWHVRQALTDRRLAFVVVGVDELEASSRRAETLRALLGRAGTLAARFPDHRGEDEPGVLVYRFAHPFSWEGLLP